MHAGRIVSCNPSHQFFLVLETPQKELVTVLASRVIEDDEVTVFDVMVHTTLTLYSSHINFNTARRIL
jgi:hypothetical protein